MRAFIFIALIFAVSSHIEAGSLPLELDNTAYGYLEKYGIPLAEKIQKAEEEAAKDTNRIVGGAPAALGEYDYQAGLLINMVGVDINRRGVCGASLISVERLITAAHCWFDGQNQAWRFEVVLGSDRLFTGGNRIFTTAVVVHENWFPFLVRNDVAIIYLPNPVSVTNNISPIALPSGSELQEDFTGSTAIASGFGLTSDNGGISQDQFLSHVSLNVISNSVCRLSFPLIVQDSNICTSGVGGVGTCQGDSGGPLIVQRNNRRILIGVTSFGSALGCQANLPAAFARVTSFIDFINRHL